MNKDETKTKHKKILVLLFGVVILSFLFNLNFISSQLQVGTSGQIGVDLNVITPVNYSLVNVNNSQYLQGLTPTQVASLFTESDPLAYNGTLRYTSNNTFYGNVSSDTDFCVVGGNCLSALSGGSSNTTNLSYVVRTGDTMTGDLNVSADVYTNVLHLPTGGGDSATTLCFGTTCNSGFWQFSATALIMSINGIRIYTGSTTDISASTTGWRLIRSGVSSTSPVIIPYKGDQDTGLGHPISPVDTLSLIAGGVEGIRIQESGGVALVGINTSSPSYPLEVNANVSGISIYTSGNVSAFGYNTHTSIFDKSVGSPFDYILDSNEYLDKDGKIDHSKFYGYVGEIEVTDYDRPVIISSPTEKFNNVTGKWYNTTNYETIYPYKRLQGEISINAEIDVLRQALFVFNDCLEKSLTFEEYKSCVANN